MLQIPTIQTCSKIRISAKAEVPLWNGIREGLFAIDLKVTFDPRTSPTGYPSGYVKLKWNRPQSMQGKIQSTVIEHVSLGVIKAGPTVFVTGMGLLAPRKPAHFWIMIANEAMFSRNVKDIISFVVLDKQGTTVAHGAGMVKKGGITWA